MLGVGNPDQVQKINQKHGKKIAANVRTVLFLHRHVSNTCMPVWATALVIKRVTMLKKADKSGWLTNQHNVKDVTPLFHATEEQAHSLSQIGLINMTYSTMWTIVDNKEV